MRLAIFDVDGTIVRGSSERMFWRYLVARGRQGPRQIAAYMLFLVRYLPTGGIHTLKKNKAYLCGLERSAIEALADDFVATRLMPRLHDAVVQRLRQHVLRGDAVVLLTGTIEPIAQALARRLGVRYVCATLCSERGGRYLAQPPETHPFGAAKLGLSRQLAAQIGCELKSAIAYGDSRHDLHLLEAVSEPVAVSPDAALLRVAIARDWEIISDRDVQRALPR
jgi:HAD superfamily hydrolase (TIGR01490 family)